MEENKFIKVLTIDENLSDSVCIVNKDEIMYFELLNYYDEEFAIGTLVLKNNKEICVSEQGIEDLQNVLLGEKIPIINKNKYELSLKTVNYILDPDNKWDKKIGIGDRINELSILTSIFKEDIATRIKLMSYQNFLETPYWKAISAYLKIVKKKCEKCGSKLNLHTHHKTYKHHGYEILHLEDLEVVCSNCHCKTHKEKK